MANFILLKSLRPAQREIVVEELMWQAAKLRLASREKREADYNKHVDQMYGYSQALAHALTLPSSTVAEEIYLIWNPAEYATKASEDKSYQAGLSQIHYANGTVALMVMTKIKAENTDED